MANLTTLSVAFKEWSAICGALALGRQMVILRKGGIAEEGGTFRVEHPRFWLYPTFVHQQQGAVLPSYHDLLTESVHNRPNPGIVRLSHHAEVVRTFHLEKWSQAQALAALHGWTEEAVKKRFEYRQPGLFVLAVRVFVVPTPHEVAESAHFLGCKSWVDLGLELPAEGLPVLADPAFSEGLSLLSERLPGELPRREP